MNAKGTKRVPVQIFAWEAYYVSCQKRLYQIKYGLEGWILIADLRLC